MSLVFGHSDESFGRRVLIEIVIMRLIPVGRVLKNFIARLNLLVPKPCGIVCEVTYILRIC